MNSPILAGRTLVGFDKFPVDRWFAHTVRLPPNCRDLARMSVKICLNASKNSLTKTDSLFFYDTENEEKIYSRSLPSLFGAWPPRSSDCKTIGFGPSNKVFQYAATNGFYHIGVQDDTGVDYIQTILSYASPKTCPSLCKKFGPGMFFYLPSFSDVKSGALQALEAIPLPSTLEAAPDRAPACRQPPSSTERLTTSSVPNRLRRVQTL